MSGQNGDKSRFNRVRKQNIRRRERNRKFCDALEKRQRGAAPASSSAESHGGRAVA